MIKAKAEPVVADRLKSFVDRVEKLEEERAAIGGDIRDVYSEAKGVGYDVPAMRRLVSYRKLDAADRAERDALDDVYRHALGMAVTAVSNGDMSLRRAAKAHGVSKSSIHRALAVPAPSREMTADDLGRPEPTPDHDHTSGGEDDEASERGGGDGGNAVEACRPPAEHGTDRGDGEAPARLGGEAGAEMPKATELQHLPSSIPAEQIDLTIPPFLRRSAA